MGSGAEAAEEAVDCLVAAGREDRHVQGSPVSALRCRGLPQRAAHDRQVDRRSRSLQGARRNWRAALSGHRDRSGRSTAEARCRLQPCRASLAAATACRRRNSRRPWSRASSTNWTRPPPKNHFTIGIDDDVTHTSLSYDPTFSTEDPEDRARTLLRTRFRRHRGRQQELHQDHRQRRRPTTRRATSSTTRRSPAR